MTLAKSSLPQRVAVLGLTRAGIVSILRSLHTPPGVVRQSYTVGDYQHDVEVSSARGLPHGLDWDVCSAIETLFFQAGSPADNRLTVTPRTLLQQAGMDDSGRYYVALRDSLLRLDGVRWTLRRSRKGSDEGETTSTGFISQMTVYDRSVGRTKVLIPEVKIEIYLTPTFADLIREGLHQMLDFELLSKLGQPTARGLYRVLQGHRIQSDGSLSMGLEVRVEDWLTACGIPSDRMDNAKLTLTRAHDHLKKAGYLRSAEFKGRGLKGKIMYSFSGACADPEQVTLLMSFGVTRPVAESLASNSPDAIAPAIKAVQERLDEGYAPKSVAAVLIDSIRNPDKYIKDARVLRAPVTTSAREQGRRAIPEAGARVTQPVLLEEPELTLDQRRDSVRSLIRMKAKRTLTINEQLRLDGLDTQQLKALSSVLINPQGIPLEEALASMLGS